MKITKIQKQITVNSYELRVKMINKKIKRKITKNILILEIAERYPSLVEILLNKYGFHCIGCSLSAIETLGEGAMAHGLNKKETEEMVEELNEAANKEDLKRKRK